VDRACNETALDADVDGLAWVVSPNPSRSERAHADSPGPSSDCIVAARDRLGRIEACACRAFRGVDRIEAREGSGRGVVDRIEVLQWPIGVGLD
jgi:hypothetical protein